jgi:gamma-glutamylcyclotransferase (GGCT)/AIG2-like uncharacterized protein YtfP
MTTLFVYGSLKRGQHHHYYLLRDSKFLGSFRTAPKYRLFNAGPYPPGEGRRQGTPRAR